MRSSVVPGVAGRLVCVALLVPTVMVMVVTPVAAVSYHCVDSCSHQPIHAPVSIECDVGGADTVSYVGT